MKFAHELYEGILIKRYKRFLADIEMSDGSQITAHCANPGSMLGLKDPGQKVWLSKSDNPKRKLAYSWELIEVDGVIVGINTFRPNALVEEAIGNGTIAELQGYASLKREVKYGKNSRIDMLLRDEDKADCYVEVKNVHFLRSPGHFAFPDSVTARGAKHLDEMSDMVALGHRAVMVYLIQRDDGDTLSIAEDLDPNYGAAFKRARANGVEAIAYACKMTPHGIEAYRNIPLVSSPSQV
ncbi:MAG: DNA/RNA nuclease SfsA [Hyphomicrobiales bacterium]|nr:DNA/RNA nuclease SfsA [Hyphomicrobiales bacterium]PCJ91824.1 MAG: DNA/RNA nuclease SfsA [Hyphomicrobiales bacterium]